MKKIFSLAVLVAALMFAGTAKAQYGTCNAQYQNGLPDVPMTMSVHLRADNYTATDPNETAEASDVIALVNQDIETQYPQSRIRFTEDESDNFNVKLIFHFTLNTDNTYSLVIEGRGLAVGHLFTFDVPGTYPGPGEAALAGVNGLPIFIVTGWHNTAHSCQ